MEAKKNKDEQTASRDAANIKLAIVLGVVALGIYVCFIWFTVK